MLCKCLDRHSHKQRCSCLPPLWRRTLLNFAESRAIFLSLRDGKNFGIVFVDKERVPLRWKSNGRPSIDSGGATGLTERLEYCGKRDKFGGGLLRNDFYLRNYIRLLQKMTIDPQSYAHCHWYTGLCWMPLVRGLVFLPCSREPGFQLSPSDEAADQAIPIPCRQRQSRTWGGRGFNLQKPLQLAESLLVEFGVCNFVGDSEDKRVTKQNLARVCPRVSDIRMMGDFFLAV